MKKNANAGLKGRIDCIKRRVTPLIITAGAVLALSVGATAPASADPVLVNGGFEEGGGSFDGWTLVDEGGSLVQCPPLPDPDVAEGFCSAALSTFTTDGTLTQSFATIPGATYLLRFAFRWDGQTPAALIASVNGNSLFSLDPLGIPSPDFVTPRLFFLATGPSTTLSFLFRDDPGHIALDAVSVSIPEPVSAALVGLGLAGLALTRRRRN